MFVGKHPRRSDLRIVETVVLPSVAPGLDHGLAEADACSDSDPVLATRRVVTALRLEEAAGDPQEACASFSESGSD